MAMCIMESAQAPAVSYTNKYLARLFIMRTKLGLLMHWDESYPEQDDIIIQLGPPSGLPASNESIQSFLLI